MSEAAELSSPTSNTENHTNTNITKPSERR